MYKCGGFGWVCFSPSDGPSNTSQLKQSLSLMPLVEANKELWMQMQKDQGLLQIIGEDEDTVLALIGIMVTMRPVELKEWKLAYEDDLKLQPAIQ